MDVNRISGYIPGKMVFFLMQASIPPSLIVPEAAVLHPLVISLCT